MNQKEIAEMLQKDVNEFYTKPWTGMLPKQFNESILQLLPLLSPMALDTSYRAAKAILEKPDNEITFYEISLITKWFLSLRPVDILEYTAYFNTMDMYIEFSSAVADTVMEWNLLYDKFGQSQERKREKLISMLPQAPQKKKI